MVIVKYTDDSSVEYTDIEEAETGILEVFAGSDNDTTPLSVEEYGADGVFIRDHSCRWSVELLGDEDDD